MKCSCELHGFFLEPKFAYLEALLYPDFFQKNKRKNSTYSTMKPQIFYALVKYKKDSGDSISSPSSLVKIQIINGKVPWR